MGSESWRSELAGERMAVDREFTERVRASQLTPQQWNLVMTAVEFEVEDPEDPERARLVADTSKLDHVLDELDAVAERTRSAGVPGGGDGGGAGKPDDGGGLLASLRSALGFGGGPDYEAVATRLAADYAEALQERLEERGRWERVRAMAAGDAE